MSEVTDHFTLDIIAPALDGFQAPEGAFEPTGEWSHRYGMYTLTGNPARVGSVCMGRQPRGDDKCLVTVAYEKLVPGEYRQRVSAEAACRTDLLCSPREWRWSFWTEDKDGNVLENSALDNRGEDKGDHVMVYADDLPRRVPAKPPRTINWCLFDVVQRLPREPFDPIAFTLLDHFDQMKQKHTLSYHGGVEVILGRKKVQEQHEVQLEKGRIRKTRWAQEGGAPARLHGYSDVGWASVPWVYWVNETGRLLFAVGGLEAYILEA